MAPTQATPSVRIRASPSPADPSAQPGGRSSTKSPSKHRKKSRAKGMVSSPELLQRAKGGNQARLARARKATPRPWAGPSGSPNGPSSRRQTRHSSTLPQAKESSGAHSRGLAPSSSSRALTATQRKLE